MTDRVTLEALLARVLEGTGPDRELDAEIHAATLHIKPITPEVIVTRECQENGFYALHHVPGSPGGVSYWHQAPPFTGSLDAALTLVPEGWHWSVSGTVNMEYHARIVPHAGSLKTFVGHWREAKSAPRALIAVCIKARMEAQGD